MRDDPAVRVAPICFVQGSTHIWGVSNSPNYCWRSMARRTLPELLGSAPSAAEELVPLYAAVFVAAMGLDTTDVAMMIPGVRLSDIRRASMLLEEESPSGVPMTG